VRAKCETVRGAITSQKLLLLLLRESPIMTALLKMQNYSHSWPFMIWWSLVVFTISTLLVWCRNWLHLACELCGCQVFHPGLGSGHVACSSKNRLKRDRFLLGKSDGIWFATQLFKGQTMLNITRPGPRSIQEVAVAIPSAIQQFKIQGQRLRCV